MVDVERERFAELIGHLMGRAEREAAMARASVIGAYLTDPVGFYRRYGTRIRPNSYQAECLTDLYKHGREAIVAPHGVGKTTIEAMASAHFGVTRDAVGIPWINPTTASTDRQLRHQLWPEIRRILRSLDWEALADDGMIPWVRGTHILEMEVKGEHGRSYAAVSRDESGIEGAHADHVLYTFDESKAVADGVFDAAEGALVGEGPENEALEAYALAASTPGAPSGRFYDIAGKKDPRFSDWHVRHITSDEAIEAGRMTETWRRRRAETWGVESALYQNRAEGRFWSDDEESAIKLAWVEAAVERWHELNHQGLVPDVDKLPEPNTCRAGVDVASIGRDKTTIARCHTVPTPDGDVIVVDLWKEDYTADVVDLAHRAARRIGRHNLATIDAVGLGLGTAAEYGKLHERHPDFYPGQYRHVAFVSGGLVPEWRDITGEVGAANRRSAGWWDLRQALDPNLDDIRPPMALPPDDELTADIVAPRVEFVGPRIKIEKKAKTKERLHRSPDLGDALMMAVYAEQTKRGATVPGYSTLLSDALAGN